MIRNNAAHGITIRQALDILSYLSAGEEVNPGLGFAN